MLTVGSRAKDTCVSASMLLVETIAVGGGGGESSTGSKRQQYGIVRAVAPLAGCAAAVDQSHKKWLHVRVRSPYSCLLAVARSPAGTPGGPGGTTISNPEAARRRLLDGHWTLAFENEGTCAAAKRMIDERAERLRVACAVAMRPFLQ